MERWIWHEDGRASGTAELGRDERRCRNPRAERHFFRGDGAPYAATSQRFGPEIVEPRGALRLGVKRLPLAAQILVEIFSRQGGRDIAAESTAHVQQHVAHVPAVEQ